MRKIRITKQLGSILIVSVIMLAVLAGLSVAVLSNSVNEKTVASNQQDQALAQEAANSTAAQVKQLLMDKWIVGTTPCTSGPCTTSPCVWSYISAFQSADFTQSSWWTANYACSVTKQNANLAANPQYIIIALGCDAVSNMYRFRIITRSVGASSNAVAFSDSVFGMPTSTQNAASCESSSGCGGGAVKVQGVADGTVEQTFTMAPSSFASYFFRNLGGSQCPQSGSSFAGCEMNCAGQIHVMAWTYDEGCTNIYGPWAPETSSLTVTLNGSQHTLMCAIPIICGGNSCSGVYSGNCLSCTNISCSPSTGCSPPAGSGTTPAPSPMSTPSTTYYCPSSPGTPSPPPVPSACTGSISCGGTTCSGTPTTGCQSCTGCSGSGSSCSCSTLSYCPGSPAPSACSESSCPTPAPSPMVGPDGLPWPAVNPSSGSTCWMNCWTGSNGSYWVEGSVMVQGSYDDQGHCVPSGYENQDNQPGGISVSGTGLTDYCSWYYNCCSPCSTCDPCGPENGGSCTYPSSNCAGCSGQGNCTSNYCWGGG